MTYGESLPSVGTGEMPPGESRVYEFMLVMLVILLAANDNVDAYELLLAPDAVDDIEADVEWNRGLGEVRDADSRRRNKSF